MSRQVLASLGIDIESIQKRNLTRYEEAHSLVMVEIDPFGKEFYLTEDAAQAWQGMKVKAQDDGVTLLLMSAFRSVERQVQIIQDKLENGMNIEAILEICAPPGYSEHHTGRAIDLASIDDPCLEIHFENTDAFSWLKKNAIQFGFSMTYPRSNPFGFQYEPWHWCFSNQ